MKNLPSDIRLTDELERQLVRRAVLEEMEMKPGVALKNLFKKVQGLFSSAKRAGKHDAPAGAKLAN